MSKRSSKSAFSIPNLQFSNGPVAKRPKLEFKNEPTSNETGLSNEADPDDSTDTISTEELHSETEDFDSETQDQSRTETLHPLHIEHILEHILSNLTNDKSSLLNLRQVCAQWCPIVTKFYVKNFPPVEITFGPHGSTKASGTRKVAKFISTFSKTTLSLSENAILFLQHFEYVFKPKFFSSSNEYLFISFFRRYSKYISSLRLQVARNFSLDVSKLCQKQSHEQGEGEISFNNLRKLEIAGDYHADIYRGRSQVEFSSAQRYDSICTLLPNMFAKSPLLDEFKCRLETEFCEADSYRPSHFQGQWESRLSRVIQPPRNLREISLSGTPGVLGLLRRKQHINLKSFSFEFSHHITLIPGLETVLLSTLLEFLHAQTQLEGLVIRGRQVENTYVPLLEKVTRLQAFCFISSNFDFLKSFPKLMDLKLELDKRSEPEHDQEMQINRRQKTYPSVKSLHLFKDNDEYRYSPSCDLLRTIAIKFPSLSDLTLPISAKEELCLLTTLFSNLQLLKTLVIEFPSAKYRYSIPLDFVLTGIPQDVCKKLLQACNKEEAFENLVVEPADRKANLADMTDLRSLTIKSANEYSFIVTDITAHFAFLNMPSLRYLTLDDYVLTEEYDEKLKSKMNVSILKGKPDQVPIFAKKELVKYFQN